MSGHTPGPWRARQDGYGWDVVATDPEEHAEAGDLYSVTGGTMPEPDARLIAAAPEMLEALELFERVFCAWATALRGSTGSLVEELAEAGFFAKGRAVTAKATGGKVGA